ncbi:hypothetical protein RUND412_011098 [Rhizina undulata]
MNKTLFRRFLPYYFTAPTASLPTPENSLPSSPVDSTIPYNFSSPPPSSRSDAVDIRNGIVIATPGCHLTAHNSTIIDASTLTPPEISSLLSTFPSATHITSCTCKSPRTYPFSRPHPLDPKPKQPDYRCPGAQSYQRTDSTAAACFRAEDQVKAPGGVVCEYCGFVANDGKAREMGFSPDMFLFGGHVEMVEGGDQKVGERFICPVRIKRGDGGRCLKGCFGRGEFYAHLRGVHGVCVVP